MIAYYNENDPKAAAWLRELIKHGAIATGDVDERSIEDVTPADLAGYGQCHFFAGIGGWSLALRLAGWPDDRPVWTGSCPCQPFSAAGKGKGFADERHLWPSWQWLIRQSRPAIIFGEQVANSDPWFDLVSADLEGEGYAIGSAVLGAHSVGAPHIRQRRFFVAHGQGYGWRQGCAHGGWGVTGDTEKGMCSRSKSGGASRFSELDKSAGSGRKRVRNQSAHAQLVSAVETRDFWDDCEWIQCRDGKARPVEPGTFPLAHGVPGRVGLLRGYGNAIVPQAAAAFIKAVVT